MGKLCPLLCPLLPCFPTRYTKSIQEVCIQIKICFFFKLRFVLYMQAHSLQCWPLRRATDRKSRGVVLIFFPLLKLNGFYPLYISMEKSNQRKTLSLWAWFQQIFLSSATRCFKLFHWTHTEPGAVGLQHHTDKRAAGLLKFIMMRQVIRSNYETVSWFSCCY